MTKSQVYGWSVSAGAVAGLSGLFARYLEFKFGVSFLWGWLGCIAVLLGVIAVDVVLRKTVVKRGG